MPYFLYLLYILPMLPVLDYLLLCCVDFENKISIYLSIREGIKWFNQFLLGDVRNYIRPATTGDFTHILHIMIFS